METAPDNPARCPGCESVRIAVDAYKVETRKSRQKQHKARCWNCGWNGKFSECFLCGEHPLNNRIRCPECDRINVKVDGETKKVECFACKWKGTIDEVNFVHPEMVNS